MSSNLNRWFTGALNSIISGAASGVTSMVMGMGLKKSLIFVSVSAGVSLAKWVLQHPLPEE